MKYVITGKNFTSPLLIQYARQHDCSLLTEDVLKLSDIEFTREDVVYASDETSFPIVMSKVGDTEIRKKLEDIKDKYNCRMYLKDRYPDFYFTDVTPSGLKSLKLPDDKTYIIKPRQGFFGVGVKKIDATTDLKTLASQIEEEVQEGMKYFSDDVFTPGQFIVEEYIDGDEYTFDLFYDSNGIPVIVNFCYHPVSKVEHYANLLYYTHADMYGKYYKQVIDIFTNFNTILGVKNLPIHAEFREKDDTLIPIEFNVTRFGGFGLADLPYYAFGVNPFEHFFEGKKPNWEKVLEKHTNKYYAWVLCYNGLGVDLKKNRPDYQKLKKDLGDVLHFYELDYKKNPAFGIAFIEKNNKKGFDELLNISFEDYFKL